MAGNYCDILNMECIMLHERQVEYESEIERLTRERDEWREKAFNLPMAAKKSGYEDGKREAEALVRKQDAEIKRLACERDEALLFTTDGGVQGLMAPRKVE